MNAVPAWMTILLMLPMAAAVGGVDVTVVVDLGDGGSGGDPLCVPVAGCFQPCEPTCATRVDLTLAGPIPVHVGVTLLP